MRQTQLWQELAAAENLALVYEVCSSRDLDAWHAKRKAYFVRNKLQGNPIPDEFNPNWTIRISTVMHGAHRVDEYHLRPSGKNGTLTLFGGAEPLPTIAEGKLEK